MSGDSNGGEVDLPNLPKVKRCKTQVPEGFQFEAAFGLPWSWGGFVQKACATGRPVAKTAGVPVELQGVIEKHMEWSVEKLVYHRMHWCRKWLKRARELEKQEAADRSERHPFVAEVTAGKRIALTREMLHEIGYEDIDALQLLSEGCTLAGEVAPSAAFEQQYKPCLATMQQLEQTAAKRNHMVLQMTKSSGDPELDKQLLFETREEIARGWIEGPIDMSQLEFGSTISHRFALRQGAKTRLIDDFSVSGVNDSTLSHYRLSLHMIDTFAASVKSYFVQCKASCKDKSLLRKTYDLKSAYRQLPVHPKHYKFAFFSVFNCEIDQAQVYRLKTMPFGATHSVYCFLRLAKLVYALATRALHLFTTSFYDDFLLASPPALCESSKSSMELLFLLTGWEFACEGKKATQFEQVCKALGVQFDLCKSDQGLLEVCNTEARRNELVEQLEEAINSRVLDKQQCLSLRGRLGFADSFLHGRLGSLVLKLLSEHAYGRTKHLGDDTLLALQMMKLRLQSGVPRRVTSKLGRQWFVFTDASYETSSATSGLGGVLFDEDAKVVSWFSVPLAKDICDRLGASEKGSLIYELELLAAILSLMLWCNDTIDDLRIWFGDNDSVRFSLIRASASGKVGKACCRFILNGKQSCVQELGSQGFPLNAT